MSSIATTTLVPPEDAPEDAPVDAPVGTPLPAAGVSAEVMTAGLILAAGLLPPLLALPHDELVVDATLPVLAWFPLGVAGVILLDRTPRSRLGWASVIAACTPLPLFLWTLLRVDGGLTPVGIYQALGEVGPGWILSLVLLVVAVAHAPDRTARRWRFWVSTTAGATMAGAFATSAVASEAAYGVMTTAGLLLVACVVATSAFVAHPRPIDEPLVDLGLVVGVAAVAGLVGGFLRWVAHHEQIFAADVVGAFAAAVSAVLAVPGALWLRREFLERRYGAGVLSPTDVAAITADLRTTGDPRQLLSKAAEMVRATSGNRSARILLDDDEVEDGWVGYPLVVGDTRVGTLSVQPPNAEGLEARQERVVAQLAPTVALVAKAVALAVEAEHARSDVAYQRDAERSRILADLHDDLGPMLAGMSMRVAAAQELTPLPALSALAEDLTACRADLRRIVAGLAPSTLASVGASQAITRLVESFSIEAGPRVVLTTPVPEGIRDDLAVVTYRSIAEGVTNALRHGHPSLITVEVSRAGHGLRLEVIDDGVGGVIVPGVGLTSLTARAVELGGSLDVRSLPDGGAQLTLVMPEPGL